MLNSNQTDFLSNFYVTSSLPKNKHILGKKIFLKRIKLFVVNFTMKKGRKKEKVREANHHTNYLGYR